MLDPSVYVNSHGQGGAPGLRFGGGGLTPGAPAPKPQQPASKPQPAANQAGPVAGLSAGTQQAPLMAERERVWSGVSKQPQSQGQQPATGRLGPTTLAKDSAYKLAGPFGDFNMPGPGGLPVPQLPIPNIPGFGGLPVPPGVPGRMPDVARTVPSLPLLAGQAAETLRRKLTGGEAPGQTPPEVTPPQAVPERGAPAGPAEVAPLLPPQELNVPRGPAEFNPPPGGPGRLPTQPPPEIIPPVAPGYTFPELKNPLQGDVPGRTPLSALRGLGGLTLPAGLAGPLAAAGRAAPVAGEFLKNIPGTLANANSWLTGSVGKLFPTSGAGATAGGNKPAKQPGGGDTDWGTLLGYGGLAAGLPLMGHGAYKSLFGTKDDEDNDGILDHPLTHLGLGALGTAGGLYSLGGGDVGKGYDVVADKIRGLLGKQSNADCGHLNPTGALLGPSPQVSVLGPASGAAALSGLPGAGDVGAPTAGSAVGPSAVPSTGDLAKSALYRVSPFCAGFVSGCRARGLSKNASARLISKCMALGVVYADEWTRTFGAAKRAGFGVPGGSAPPPVLKQPVGIPPLPKPPVPPPAPPGGTAGGMAVGGTAPPAAPQAPAQAPVPEHTPGSTNTDPGAPPVPTAVPDAAAKGGPGPGPADVKGTPPPAVPGQAPAGAPDAGAVAKGMPAQTPSSIGRLFPAWDRMNDQQKWQLGLSLVGMLLPMLTGGYGNGVMGTAAPLLGLLAGGHALTGSMPWEANYWSKITAPSSWGGQQQAASQPGLAKTQTGLEPLQAGPSDWREALRTGDPLAKAEALKRVSSAVQNMKLGDVNQLRGEFTPEDVQLLRKSVDELKGYAGMINQAGGLLPGGVPADMRAQLGQLDQAGPMLDQLDAFLKSGPGRQQATPPAP